MDEESLTNFMAITGADATTAQQYLEATNWNMEEAMNFFMESGGSGSSYPTTNATSSSSFDPFVQQDVRAPDPSKRQRLVGGEFDGHGAFPTPAEYFRGRNMNEFSNTPHNPHGLFQRDFAAESIANINAHLRHSGSVVSNPRDPKNLSQLFQPPVGLMFHGTLSEARQFAKREGKWLLVNIQDETVFASLQLNRDTWSDDFVQNLVSSGFIFWQSYVNTDQGKKFCALYQIDVDMLPVTCILDPRTGQKVIEWHNFIEPQTMTEKLSDFSCLNPITSNAATQPPAPVAAPVRQERTEDEELAAAIAASLEPNDEQDHNDDSQDEDDGMGEETKEETVTFEPLPTEPSDGPTVTRLQIRTTVGTRLVRRFNKSDPVSILWRFVYQEIPEARTRPFELRTTFPPASIQKSETSLVDSKLENASVLMQWS